MSGTSSATGLRILEKETYVPNLILLEANNMSIAKEDDGELIAASQNKSPDLMLETVNFDARPINVLLGLMKRMVPEADYTNKTVMRMRDNELRFFRKHIDDYKRRKLTRQANEFKRLVHEFQSRGAKVVLFDVPMDPRATNSNSESDGRALLARLLPESEFNWLHVAAGPWQTTDVIHLTWASARSYAQALESELQRSCLAATKQGKTI